MGIYRTAVFPRLMNAGMTAQKKYRTRALAEVTGDVLEIGFGTGLNIPHYPKQIHKLTAIDSNPGMGSLARKHIAQSRSIEVDLRTGDAQRLPFADGTFDSVVSTWTLCSIPDVTQALREVQRVLKPGGRFFFIEHGLSAEPSVQRWQNRLTPINKRLLDGCHLNRNILHLVGGIDWKVERVENFYAEKVPRAFGYLYQGVAHKSS